MITGEEFERRLRRISQLRDLCIHLRYAALEAWRARQIPFKPETDIRSDYEYWSQRAKEKGIGIPS